jgi:alkanesulfonate monooxygenase SsuD/methylene tetrahydromethanopterin reductase-like flavin-dependent oxidoreductase (luciferase family)
VHPGVNVPSFGPGTTPEALGRWAQVAEGLGFDLLMLSDHVTVTVTVTVTEDVARSYPGPFHDAFTTLA